VLDASTVLFQSHVLFQTACITLALLETLGSKPYRNNMLRSLPVHLNYLPGTQPCQRPAWKHGATHVALCVFNTWKRVWWCCDVRCGLIAAAAAASLAARSKTFSNMANLTFRATMRTNLQNRQNSNWLTDTTRHKCCTVD
jgi:hypothetical protein